MPMTYSGFITYYTRKMWRTGDTDWNTDLPQLMKKAEARINRDLRTIALIDTVEYTLLTNELSLPPLFASVNYLVDKAIGAPMEAVDASQFILLRTAYLENGAGESLYYTYQGSTPDGLPPRLLLLTSPDIDNPTNVIFSYYTGSGNYETTPDTEEHFYDVYPDFYEAAVNVYAYEYLRDFELSSEYNSQYLLLLEGMKSDSEYKTYPEGQIKVSLPGNVL